jgi:hypothetical protein
MRSRLADEKLGAQHHEVRPKMGVEMTSSNIMDYFFALKKPCNNCPFRKTGAIELRPTRLKEIIEHLTDDDHASFSCHKTVHRRTWNEDEDEDDTHSSSEQEAMCAGAMIYLQKIGCLSVPMRLGVVSGHYDMAAMAAQSDVVINRPPE